MAFARITTDPDRMGGQPCVRDLRFPVAAVVAMVADGMTVEDITTEHPDLEPDDIEESLRQAPAPTCLRTSGSSRRGRWRSSSPRADRRRGSDVDG